MSSKFPKVHGLSFYSVQSLGIHILFFAVAMLFAKFTWDALKLQREENIQLVQSSVRVDVVAMPELTVKELKIFEPQAEEAVVETQPEQVKEPETKPDQPEFVEEKKQQDFASMLKNLSQKKVQEKPAKKNDTKPKNNFDSSKINKLVAAGNKLSAGSALVGGESVAADSEYGRFLSSMPEAVKPYWKLPSYLSTQELKARVRVYIRADGSLIKAELYESSGVSEYDQRAMEAVRQAKFSPLPEGYSSRGISGEIVLGFPL